MIEIMEQSYWFQERQKQIAAVTIDLEKCQEKIQNINGDLFEECDKRYNLEQQMKSSKNKKEIQRQLDSIKNKQLGPKWNAAWLNYNSLIAYKKEFDNIQSNLTELQNHKAYIDPYIQFLFEIEYLYTDNPQSNKDLTLKGILATEVNEGHPILMTELYTREMLHNLSGEETVVMLSCFLESEMESANVITKLAEEFQTIEDKWIYPMKDYWKVSTEMMEPIRKWMEGENASVICMEYEIFEGNFVRSILKMANIVDEWIAMATYCQHIEQIDKMMEIRPKIVRESSDSLYLHI